jgi:poly-gamma-glutamate synthesis protein (capsule biosynthesis protein)
MRLTVLLLGLCVATPTLAQQPARLRLVAVGDVAPGGPQGALLEKDAADVLGVTAQAIRDADLAFVNLEAPLPPATAESWPRGSLPLLVGKPSLAQALVAGGFDVASLANNHVFDYHREGVDGTLGALAKAGLPSTGLGITREAAEAPVIVEKNGLRIGFLAATDRNNRPSDPAPRQAFVSWLRPDELAQRIRKLRPQVDVVVVAVHWGQSYSLDPLPSQRRIAKQLVAAGADLVVGHHPHVLQPIERVDGVPVAYSMGNFLFGQQEGDRGRTVALQVDFARQPGQARVQAVAVQCVPAVVNAQRRLVAPTSVEDKAAFARWLQRSTACER